MAYLRYISGVKYFVVNDETTAAFTNNVFSETFPNYDFDNVTPVDLTTLSDDYEIKLPVKLGENVNNGTINSNGTVTSSESGFFSSCEVGDYLFVQRGEEKDLNILGKIKVINSATIVTLESVPQNVIYGGLGANNANKNIYHLSKNSVGLPFGENSSFYMLIQNSDYDDDENFELHNSIPYINPTVTSVSDDYFAYGGSASGNNIINPKYFAIVPISTISNATDGLTNAQISYVDSIPCTITPISTLSQQLTIPSESDAISASDIPYWSVYLINPYGLTSSSILKNTTYKIEIDDQIPVRKLEITPTLPPTP